MIDKFNNFNEFDSVTSRNSNEPGKFWPTEQLAIILPANQLDLHPICSPTDSGLHRWLHSWRYIIEVKSVAIVVTLELPEITILARYGYFSFF